MKNIIMIMTIVVGAFVTSGCSGTNPYSGSHASSYSSISKSVRWPQSNVHWRAKTYLGSAAITTSENKRLSDPILDEWDNRRARNRAEVERPAISRRYGEKIISLAY
jgi:hypothetical protein